MWTEQAHTPSPRPASTRSRHGSRAASRWAAERSIQSRAPRPVSRLHHMGLERVADRRTGMGSESAAVVTRAMHGDHDAFATLIGLATNRLYALACLILRDTDRAEDAAQEAIVR